MSALEPDVRADALAEIIAARRGIENVRSQVLPGQRLYEQLSRAIGELSAAIIEMRALV